VAGALHRFHTSAHWRGSTGSGYEDYRREHTVEAAGVDAALTLSSDAAFRGDAAALNPEVLLLAAAVSCQLLSFLAVAARAGLDVIAYDDDADAEMPEDLEPMRITRIVLRPRITVRGEVTESRLDHLVEVAHRECYIANSLRGDVVVVEPAFVFA
jgi:organic hydroperoxide reductase OsmC/OhrA